MSHPDCSTPLSLEILAGYLRGELDEVHTNATEEHYFACAACAQRLAGLQVLGAGVAELLRSGRLASAVSVPTIERAAAEGLRMQVYRLAPGESAQCSIAPGDAFNALRLAADFHDVEYVDLVTEALTDPAQLDVMEDIVVDRQAGEAVLVYPGDFLRTLPKHTLRVELRGHTRGQVRSLARYTLFHTPTS
ncbi:MAG: hypothetical protein IPM13_18835 [Phycisphaerales bacterium]|nr:hypothetical protein [Phycisphaerales bacterium]